MNWADFKIAEKAGLVVDKERVDGIQTTTKATLSTAGWYRVAEYVPIIAAWRRGGAGNSCELIIRKTTQGELNEVCFLQLDSVEVTQKLYSTRRLSRIASVTKARYTYDSTKAYLEIYYDSAITNYFMITVNTSQDSGGAWKTIVPTATSETVDGVTVTTTYDIPANASPVTNLDIKDNTLWTELTSGFNLNNALGKYRSYYNDIIASLVNKPTSVTWGSLFVEWYPSAKDNSYGMQKLVCVTDKVTEFVRHKQYSTWSTWVSTATTADLANYVAKTGDIIRSGLLRNNGAFQVCSDGETSVNTTFYNGKRNVLFQIGATGAIGFYDNTNQKNIFQSTADGTNTFNGTASGNLPLSGGGTVSSPNPTPLVLQNTDSTPCYMIYRNKNSLLGYIGFSAVDNPIVLGSGGTKLGDILHTGNSAKVAIQSSAPTDTSALWVW